MRPPYLFVSSKESRTMNTAAKVVQLGILFEGSNVAYDVVAVGLDIGAKNYYMTASGRPANPAWAKAMGSSKWIGTRFSDGSAVAASGHTRLPVEFLGYFHGEQA